MLQIHLGVYLHPMGLDPVEIGLQYHLELLVLLVLLVLWEIFLVECVIDHRNHLLLFHAVQ